MDLQEKAIQMKQAQKNYEDLDGIKYEKMVDNGWDCLLSTADRKIYQEVFGISVEEAVDCEWHSDFLDILNEMH